MVALTDPRRTAARCSIRTDRCSARRKGAKRIVGRVTASKDRFRIRRVILVRLDDGTNVPRRDQPGLMASASTFPRRSFRRRTGRPSPSDPVNLEHRLCRIKPDGRNIHRGRSLCLAFKTKLHSGADDAVTGGVHTIRVNGREPGRGDPQLPAMRNPFRADLPP